MAPTVLGRLLGSRDGLSSVSQWLTPERSEAQLEPALAYINTNSVESQELGSPDCTALHARKARTCEVTVVRDQETPGGGSVLGLIR